jgi:hypothetical protein
MRPSHPATYVRDDRETPLVRRGMRGDKAYFSEKRKCYFSENQLMETNALNGLGK